MITKILYWLAYNLFLPCLWQKNAIFCTYLFNRIADVFAEKNAYNVQGGIKGHGAFAKDYKTEVAEGATLNQNIS